MDSLFSADYILGEAMSPIARSHAVLGGLLTAFIVHDLRMQFELKKSAELYLQASTHLKGIIAAQETQINYLIHILNENDVVVNDFDMIALNFNII